MPTPSQIEASRLNGAKSHGPVTPEGRARSSQNSLQHGLFAQTLVLPHEDRAQFDQLQFAYTAKFQPADDVESDLVREMVAAKWRQQRVWTLETNTLELQMVRDTAANNAQFMEIDGEMRLAIAHESLANESKTLAQIARAEARYSRQYDRALNNLLKLRKAGIVSAPLPELQNEPAAAAQNEPEPPASSDPNEPERNEAVQNEPGQPAPVRNEPNLSRPANVRSAASSPLY